MLLLGVGNCAGKNKHQAVRIDGSFDGRLDRSRQDDLNGDVRAIALYLELFNFSRAACSVLRSA